MRLLSHLYAAAALSAVALAAVPTPAFAQQGWTVTTNGPHGRNWTTVLVPRTGGSIAQIIRVPEALMTDEQRERDAKWLEFCEPLIIAQAPDWVRRYVYKHPGCENGRTE